jgi:hypothetical protein
MALMRRSHSREQAVQNAIRALSVIGPYASSAAIMPVKDSMAVAAIAMPEQRVKAGPASHRTGPGRHLAGLPLLVGAGLLDLGAPLPARAELR